MRISTMAGVLATVLVSVADGSPMRRCVCPPPRRPVKRPGLTANATSSSARTAWSPSIRRSASRQLPRLGAQQGNTHLIWERLPETQLSTVGRQFVGFRRLAYTERTVEKTPTISGGPNAQATTERDTSRTGYIVYTPTGHMVVHIMRPNRNKYAGQTPTSEEAQAALQTYTSYFGRFTVDETGKFVIHHQDGHLNPGTVGADAKRFFQFDGTRLTLQPPPTTTDGETATNRLIWEMLPPVR